MATRKRRAAKKNRPPVQENDVYYSRAVAKALEILQILSNNREPMSLSDVTAAVKLTKASVYRLLHTLEQTGYVRKTEDSRYQLTHDLRRGIQDRLCETLLRAARPVLRDLTREFRETTGLAMLFTNHIEVVEVVESPQTVRMGNTVGRILQPHASSLGKCIAAWQPDNIREHLLRSYGISRYTDNTITDENLLEREFQTIRHMGYAEDRGETCADGHCFGAPIVGPDGNVFAAISISVPVSRLGLPGHQQYMIDRIMESAQTISRALLPNPA